MSLFTHLSTIQQRGGYRSGPAWAVCKSSPTPLQAFQDSWQRVPWRVLAMPHSAVGNEHLAKNPWDPPTPSNLREWRSVAWEGGETERVCRRGRGNNAGNYKRVLRQQKMEIIIDLPTIKNCTIFFPLFLFSPFPFANLWSSDPLFRPLTLLHLSYYRIFEKIGFLSFDLPVLDYILPTPCTQFLTPTFTFPISLFTFSFTIFLHTFLHG